MTKPPTRRASTTRRDYIPVTVPFSATPAGELPGIDQWAHRAVWTDRMVATLMADNVRGGKWHTLMDKVSGSLNLSCSAKKVLGKNGAAGVDRQTCSEFAEHERAELDRLQAELGDGTYRPAAVRRRWIPKPDRSAKRPLGIPTVRDRVVQTAVVHVLEPIMDAMFHARSCGCRHGRGCHDALRCVEEWLDAGYVYVVDADVQEYYETIPKDRLVARVQQKISDRRVVGLVKKCLNQGILEELREWTPEAGGPQGAVLSPMLSNVYLNPLDHRMSDLGFQMVRYADDCAPRRRTKGRQSFVQPCCTRDEGRPLEVAVQAEASNHPWLLPLREVVVSAMGKGRARPCQVWTVESNVSEPLRTCRKRRDDVKTGGGSLLREESGGHLVTGQMASGMKAARRRSRLLWRTWEPVTPMRREKRKWRSHKRESTEAGYRGGATRSSEEGSVMELERRGCLIGLEGREQPAMGGLS